MKLFMIAILLALILSASLLLETNQLESKKFLLIAGMGLFGSAIGIIGFIITTKKKKKPEAKTPNSRHKSF